MTLDQIDTSKFLVDPKSKDFVKSMHELSDVFDFKLYKANQKKFLVYLTLVYDKESYFRKDVKNFIQRKYEAAVCADLRLNEDGHFAREVEDVIVGQNSEFNRAIVQYVSMQFNLEYAKIVVYEFNLYKKIQESFSKFDDKGLMKNLIDDLSNDISELEKKVFGGEEVTNVRKALYEGTNKSRLNLRPEEMLEEYAINKLRHLSPWGNYDLDQIQVNFVGDEIPK